MKFAYEVTSGLFVPLRLSSGFRIYIFINGAFELIFITSVGYVKYVTYNFGSNGKLVLQLLAKKLGSLGTNTSFPPFLRFFSSGIGPIPLHPPKGTATF